jgi:hypothetical protein
MYAYLRNNECGKKSILEENEPDNSKWLKVEVNIKQGIREINDPPDKIFKRNENAKNMHTCIITIYNKKHSTKQYNLSKLSVLNIDHRQTKKEMIQRYSLNTTIM